MEGDAHRANEIIEFPENYEDMKKKLLEREEEQLKRVLLRRKAETASELADTATKAIVTRANRTSPDHKPLKDRTILTEAKNEDIKDLKKKLNEEINQIGRSILGSLSKEDVETLEPKVVGLSELKGRIRQNLPPAPDGESE